MEALNETKTHVNLLSPRWLLVKNVLPLTLTDSLSDRIKSRLPRLIQDGLPLTKCFRYYILASCKCFIAKNNIYTREKTKSWGIDIPPPLSSAEGVKHFSYVFV